MQKNVRAERLYRSLRQYDTAIRFATAVNIVLTIAFFVSVRYFFWVFKTYPDTTNSIMYFGLGVRALIQVLWGCWYWRGINNLRTFGLVGLESPWYAVCFIGLGHKLIN